MELSIEFQTPEKAEQFLRRVNDEMGKDYYNQPARYSSILGWGEKNRRVIQVDLTITKNPQAVGAFAEFLGGQILRD